MTTAFGIGSALRRLHLQYGDGPVSQKPGDPDGLEEQDQNETIGIFDEIIFSRNKIWRGPDEKIGFFDIIRFAEGPATGIEGSDDQITIFDFLQFGAPTPGSQGLSGNADRLFIDDRIVFPGEEEDIDDKFLGSVHLDERGRISFTYNDNLPVPGSPINIADLIGEGWTTWDDVPAPPNRGGSGYDYIPVTSLHPSFPNLAGNWGFVRVEDLGGGTDNYIDSLALSLTGSNLSATAGRTGTLADVTSPDLSLSSLIFNPPVVTTAVDQNDKIVMDIDDSYGRVDADVAITQILRNIPGNTGQLLQRTMSGIGWVTTAGATDPTVIISATAGSAIDEGDLRVQAGTGSMGTIDFGSLLDTVLFLDNNYTRHSTDDEMVVRDGSTWKIVEVEDFLSGISGGSGDVSFTLGYVPSRSTTTGDLRLTINNVNDDLDFTTLLDGVLHHDTSYVRNNSFDEMIVRDGTQWKIVDVADFTSNLGGGGNVSNVSLSVPTIGTATNEGDLQVTVDGVSGSMDFGVMLARLLYDAPTYSRNNVNDDMIIRDGADWKIVNVGSFVSGLGAGGGGISSVAISASAATLVNSNPTDEGDLRVDVNGVRGSIDFGSLLNTAIGRYTTYTRSSADEMLVRDGDTWKIVDVVDFTSGLGGAGGSGITAINPGPGISGGGTTGSITVSLDLDNLTYATPVSTDSIAFIDENATDDATRLATIGTILALADTGWNDWDDVDSPGSQSSLRNSINPVQDTLPIWDFSASDWKQTQPYWIVESNVYELTQAQYNARTSKFGWFIITDA